MDSEWIPKFKVGDIVSSSVPATMDSAKTIIEIDEERQVYVFDDGTEDGLFIDVWGTSVESIEYISLPSWVPKFEVGDMVSWPNRGRDLVTKIIVKIRIDKELYEFNDGTEEYGLYVDEYGTLVSYSPAPSAESSSKKFETLLVM